MFEVLESKVCSKCKIEKEPSKFYKDRTKKTGLSSFCKKCTSATNKTWRENNPVKTKLRTKKWYKENREKRKNYHKKYYDKNKEHLNAKNKDYESSSPKKLKARTILNNAVRDGILLRPVTCCIKSNECHGKIEAHHCDYDKPLEVMWMCRVHHKTWHSMFIPENE